MSKIDNLKGVAADFGVPVPALIDFCTGFGSEPLEKVGIKETLSHRIAVAEEVGLDPQYINGLKDARKLL